MKLTKPLTLIAALLTAASCRDTQPTPNAPVDAATADVRFDATSRDAEDIADLDQRADASADSGSDAATDASVDAATDAGPTDPCETVNCPALFERCIEGACVEYAPCEADQSCADGLVCVVGRCVPDDLDLDGDGYSAADDCNDAEPWVNPDAPEICGPADDNCDGTVDNGDPAALCDWAPGGGVCVDGNCGCPDDAYDIDPNVPGCECNVAPPLALGRLCGAAIDLGSFNDSGESTVVTGHALPKQREDWYRFSAVDLEDTSCDEFHVRVQFLANPDDAFEYNVFRGDCDDDGTALVDYVWANDFASRPDGSGECPCTAVGEPGMPGVNVCTDNGADFYVRVRRDSLAAPITSCASYQLEISNGVYSTAP